MMKREWHHMKGVNPWWLARSGNSPVMSHPGGPLPLDRGRTKDPATSLVGSLSPSRGGSNPVGYICGTFGSFPRLSQFMTLGRGSHFYDPEDGFPFL